MRVCGIIQARMGSTRLPGKVLMPLAGKPVLQRIIERVESSETVDCVAVATSNQSGDNPIEELCSHLNGAVCFRGSESDVLDRFHGCASMLNSDVIVRLTADDPFFDSEIIDRAIRHFIEESDLDYLFYRKGLPLGTAVEVVSSDALERAWRETTDPECREHVTPYLYRNPDRFRIEFASCEGPDYSDIRLTVDTQEDFEVAEWIYSSLGEDGALKLDRIIDLVESAEKPLANSGIKQKVVKYAGE